MDSSSQAIITDPTHLLILFAGFVGAVFLLSHLSLLQPLFRLLPPIVWVYLLPVFATTCGLTPASSPLYEWCSAYLLPFALLLLTLSTDIRSIAKLGPLAICMLCAGTVGIVLGGPLVLALFQSQLPADTWKGLGALAGSWIGGPSNMLAIKEGVSCPEEVFAPMVIVDSVVGYGWMAILISISSYQNQIDSFNGANRGVIDELNERLASWQRENSRPLTLPFFAMMFGLGFAASWMCMQVGNALPELGDVLSRYTYGILVVVVVGLALSFTPAQRLEQQGASAVAYTALYLTVATMGAGGDLTAVLKAPLLFLLGVLWIGFHVACLCAAMRWLRAPIFLAATGSMGNVGGVISTPVVAGVYQRALPAVGLLMGVLGNLIGTPAGLLCAQLMAWVARAYYGDIALR